MQLSKRNTNFKPRIFGYILFLIMGIGALFFLNLIFGSVDIPASSVFNILKGGEPEKMAWGHIVLESRLPQAITALLTGGAIALSGLLLQTAFQNPLAESGILGISAGASLGVAVVILFLGGFVGGVGGFNLSYSMTITVGAFAGAVIVLGIVMLFSSIVKNNLMLLIIGIMIGYLISSVISLLKFWSVSDNAFAYMMWGMGNFSSISSAQLPFYCSVVGVGLLLSVFLIKPLNALLLGERYAANLGINVKFVRFVLLLCAGLLTAITTAYCGPISFIGLAVPHMARLFFKTSNHTVLLPATVLMGSFIALMCNIICVLPGSGQILPLNAITPVFGAPVIIYVIINQKRIQYFN